MSSSTSSRRPRSDTASRSGSGVASRSSTPSCWAMALSTSPGSRSGARSTKTTSSAKSPANAPATSIASRVLPTPPGPVSVSSWVSPRRSSFTTAAVTPARPISGVSGRGMARRGVPATSAVSLAAPGRAGRAAASSSARCSGPAPSASASSATVASRGLRSGSRSRSLTALALSPARSARASWVRPAASRCRLSSAANVTASGSCIGVTATGPAKGNSGSARPVARFCRHRPWDQAPRRDGQGASRCPRKS